MLKQIVLFLAISALMPLLGLSQQTMTLTVSGTITDMQTGSPLPNVVVNIRTDSTCTSAYTGTATSNSSGVYSTSFSVNATPDCYVTISAATCGGSQQSVTGFSTSANTVVEDFSFYCQTPDPCSASFSFGILSNVVYVSGNTLNTQGTVSYSWNFGNGTTANTQNAQATLPDGNHIICLTILDSVGCTSTYCDTLLVTNVAISQPEEMPFIQIYPNPSPSDAMAKFSLNKQAEVAWILQNVMGQTIWENKQKMQAGEQEVALSLQNLPKGIYMLNISINGFPQNLKIVKD